jgi:murein L,D-transpeptidase YafK
MSYRPNVKVLAQGAALGALAIALAGCNNSGGLSNMRAYQPLSAETEALMAEKGTNKGAPMLIRAYKKEAELEIWKMKSDGKYTLFKTYPMCRWSGQLGPKKREGDRQVPEGFYTITPGQMNPNSSYYLSFNVGYPNAYDRAHGYSGGSIMVHGACSSAGCFSMTDKQIAEIYAVARESFSGGQRAIQMQSLPFRMTAENLAKHRLDPNMPFWRQLKKGSDYFDVARDETPVSVCGSNYAFGRAGCGSPSSDPVMASVEEKERRDDARVAALANEGVKPIRLMYADGGQNPQFASSAHAHEVSRADALAQGPTEIELNDKAAKSPLVKVMAGKSDAKTDAKQDGKTDVKPAAVAQKPAISKKDITGSTVAVKADEAAAPVAAAPAEKPSMFSRLLGRGEHKVDEAKSAPVELSAPITDAKKDVKG